MNLKMVVKLGTDCGMHTLRQCYANVDINSANFFGYVNADKELASIIIEIEELAKEYGISEEEVLDWTVQEYKLYV